MIEERTLILVKPDGVAAGHIGDVISRIERRRFQINALKVVTATDELINEHYNELVGEPFFPSIANFMKEGPVVAIIASGTNIIDTFHKMAGATKPSEAAIGTIRGDFARDWSVGAIRNVVHSSNNVENAEREIAIWFPEEV
ncbi:MAG: nucleoside-diphosphate kinase [Enterococcus sp.]